MLQNEEELKKIRDFVATVSSYYNISNGNSNFAYLPYHTIPIPTGGGWFSTSNIEDIKNNEEAQDYIKYVTQQEVKMTDTNYSGSKLL